MPRTTSFWPYYYCCLPCQAQESHPPSVTPAVLQQSPLPLYFLWAPHAFEHFDSDPVFCCNSPLHLRPNCSKAWRRKRGSTCPKSPPVLHRSCWEQSRNWYEGALTLKSNTHNISPSVHEEAGKAQHSTGLEPFRGFQRPQMITKLV